MGYVARAKEIIDKQNRNSSNIDNFTNMKLMTLVEFSKKNIAIPVYSNLLSEEIWFCSNEYMLEKVRKDNPIAVCYLASELIKIIKSNPDKDHLMKLHLTKKIFDGTVLNQ